MQLSAFTDILDRPFEDSLDALAGIGLQTVDLRSRIGADNVDSLTGSDRDRARKAILDRHLAVGCVASWGVNPMSGDYDPEDPAYRQAMRQRTGHLADLAVEMGTRHVRVYSFKRPDRPLTDADRAGNAAFLVELAEICVTRDVLLLVENEPPTITATCAELEDLVRRAASPHQKINWDIVNGWRAGELPWQEGVFDAIAGHVAQVHVKGARAGPDGAFQSMALPGEDDIPHQKIIGQLRDSGFDGIITIDPHYPQFTAEDQLRNTPDPVLEVVRRTKRFLEGI